MQQKYSRTIFWFVGFSFCLNLTTALAADPQILHYNELRTVILNTSPEAKAIVAKYKSSRLHLQLVESRYDWMFSLQSGYERDSTVSATSVQTTTDRRWLGWLHNIELSKSLSTGTLLSLSANYDAYTLSSSTNPNPNDSHFWSYQFTIEQSLWANSFGSADRKALKAAREEFENQNRLELSELQDLVLKGENLFWAAVTSRQNYDESTQAFERYKKLVSSVQRRQSLGYASPGEYAQAQAELESRFQSSESNRIEADKKLRDFKDFLGLSAQDILQFDYPQQVQTVQLPPLPPLQSLRVYQIENSKLQSAQFLREESEYKDRWSVDFIGEINSTATEDRFSTAFQEMNRGKNTQNYVGLRLRKSFGSDILGETAKSLRAQEEIQKIRRDQTLKTTSSQIENLRLQIESKRQVVASLAKQKNMRTEALRELTKTYNQGRTDISILIEAMNKVESTEVEHSQALGDFFTSITQWLAVTDQLLTAPSL